MSQFQCLSPHSHRAYCHAPFLLQIICATKFLIELQIKKHSSFVLGLNSVNANIWPQFSWLHLFPSYWFFFTMPRLLSFSRRSFFFSAYLTFAPLNWPPCCLKVPFSYFFIP